MSDNVIDLSERMKNAAETVQTMADWAADGGSFRDGEVLDCSITTGGYIETQPPVRFEAK